MNDVNLKSIDNKTPKLRFKKDDGSDYPEWNKKFLSAV